MFFVRHIFSRIAFFGRTLLRGAFACFAFGGFLDGVELFIPEPLEGLDPVVNGFEEARFEGVKAVLALALDGDEADFAEDAEVFGNGRLGHAQFDDEVADGLAGAVGKGVDDIAAAAFGDGVEGIGCGGGSWHGKNICLYGNMSRGKSSRGEKLCISARWVSNKSPGLGPPPGFAVHLDGDERKRHI